MAANIDLPHSGRPSNSYHKKVKSYLITIISGFIISLRGKCTGNAGLPLSVTKYFASWKIFTTFGAGLESFSP